MELGVVYILPLIILSAERLIDMLHSKRVKTIACFFAVIMLCGAAAMGYHRYEYWVDPKEYPILPQYNATGTHHETTASQFFSIFPMEKDSILGNDAALLDCAVIEDIDDGYTYKVHVTACHGKVKDHYDAGPEDITGRDVTIMHIFQPIPKVEPGTRYLLFAGLNKSKSGWYTTNSFWIFYITDRNRLICCNRYKEVMQELIENAPMYQDIDVFTSPDYPWYYTGMKLEKFLSLFEK